MISADLGRSRPISADLGRLRCDVRENKVVLTSKLGRHCERQARPVDAIRAIYIRRDSGHPVGEHVALIILCRPPEECALVEERAVPAPNLHNELMIDRQSSSITNVNECKKNECKCASGRVSSTKHERKTQDHTSRRHLACV